MRSAPARNSTRWAGTGSGRSYELSGGFDGFLLRSGPRATSLCGTDSGQGYGNDGFGTLSGGYPLAYYASGAGGGGFEGLLGGFTFEKLYTL